jgi:putative DNA methylase
VAVLINKAMIEIPPKFAGRSPVSLLHSRQDVKKKELDLEREWPGATGLAEDVRYYGAWMREEAQKRIGHLYPPVEITAEMAMERPDLKPLVGQKLTVIAWLWARTVKSPNPAFSHVDVPLASSFILSSKTGKEAYVQPIIEGDDYRFSVKIGIPTNEAKTGTSAGKRQAFRCLLSDVPMSYDHIREQGKLGRMSAKLMAVVAEGLKGRVYLSPTPEMEAIAQSAKPVWKPNCEMPKKHRNFQPPGYGMNNIGDLFTNRQLVALTTFSDLVEEVRKIILDDAITADLTKNSKVVSAAVGGNDNRGLAGGGLGPLAYGEAVSVYLAFAVDRLVMTGNSLVRWNSVGEKAQHCFGRQALPMLWDFAEPNFLGTATGCIDSAVFYAYDPLSWLPNDAVGHVTHADAQTQRISHSKIISTDPPYYDNICYGDLSDFFYAWIRKNLKSVFPSLLATMAVPKIEELIAAPQRQGGKENADSFFLNGMTQAMKGLADQSFPEGPLTIYYAVKQSDTEDDFSTSSSGWETFLEAVHRAGLQLSGTWPLRTEMKTRQVAMGANALASSIVLVCRKRPVNAPSISRREFIRDLKVVLPEALDVIINGSGDDRSPVAPVDLSQAIIGPGMAVFSKYSAVLEADGSHMSVRTALQLINRFLGGDDFDPDTQFCLQWFEQFGWGTGDSGVADGLARAKNTSENGLVSTGVIFWKGGKTRLLKWAEYPTDWDPRTDTRTPVWEALHQLIRALKQGGESASGVLLAALGGKAEAVRQLAYRLYTLCERLGQAEDARAYNELITSWTGIETAAASTSSPLPAQGELRFDA